MSTREHLEKIVVGFDRVSGGIEHCPAGFRLFAQCPLTGCALRITLHRAHGPTHASAELANSDHFPSPEHNRGTAKLNLAQAAIGAFAP